MNFVDTNILVQATTPTAPDNRLAQTALFGFAMSGPTAISRQTLREYVSVATRPQVWASPLALSDAMQKANGLAQMFTLLEDGPLVWSELESLARRHQFGGKQVHDANLVATMLAHGATRLLTFNAKHFRRFAPLIEVVEP